tara:strand:- start:190 stop:333 length:144 start_codon:yes stop_codon:yes gene_type:complete
MEEFLFGGYASFRQRGGGLFPSFEKATGMTQGVTSVMRIEHEQAPIK